MIPSLQFRARHAHTSSDLKELIEEKSGRGTRTCAVADLTLGSWTAHSLARQWLSQMAGKELAYKTDSGPVSSSLGEAMSAGIDQDSKGNRVVLDIVSIASQVYRMADRHAVALVVMAPCYGNAWRSEDRLLIEYLKSAYKSLDLTLVIAGENPAVWPDNWEVTITGDPSHVRRLQNSKLLSLFPSALSPSARKSFTEDDLHTATRLPNGWAIVAPECRRNPEDPDSRFSKAEVAEMKGNGQQQLMAYAMYHSDRTFCDPWVFCGEAWKQFGSGYQDLGLLYIAASEAAARNSAEKAGFASHKQAMRIAMARYLEAAGEDDPDPQLPGEVKGFLMETKGWGLVMSGSPQRALPYLRQALTLCKPVAIDKSYLFLMNITALAEVRSGNYANALELEKKIEELMASLEIGDSRIVFVNSINLARLYRYSGELEESERYYNQAFATVDGARTDTDSVNVNLCLARVVEGRSDHRETFMCWLRAALYWAASDCPESLNWRVQSLVLGKGALIAVKSVSEGFQLVERLSTAFLENLSKYSELCGNSVEPDPAQHKVCRFLYADTDCRGLTPLRYLGGAGWAVIGADGATPQREYGPMYQKLNLWLSAWISLAAGQEGENCYLVDRRDGSEMPRNWPQILDRAAEFNIGRVTYERGHVEIGSSELEALNRTREARLNPIVARIEDDGSHIVVHFKRYLQPYSLSSDEQRVFRTIRAQASVLAAKGVLSQEGLKSGNVDDVLSRLRKLRILTISRSCIGSEGADLRQRDLAPAPV